MNYDVLTFYLLNGWTKMRGKKIIIWLALVVLALTVNIGTAIFNKQNPEKITIAIAAPLSNAGQATETAGRSMLRGAELYVKEVNRAGGISGKQLKLEVYDDQANPSVTEAVAQKIVRSKAVAVIGHYSSSTSEAAGKIYQAAGIPAISGSATADSVTQENDWYFRTIFSDSFQGKFIAYYLKQVLGFSKIALIHGYDAYGLGLSQTIEAQFQQLGGEILAKWKLEANQNKASDQIIIQQLQKLKDIGQAPEAVLLATNRDQVTNLLAEMKRRQLNFPLFGGDDLGDVANAQAFADYPEEKENLGFFTNGLYATVPIIYDVADDRMLHFRRTFEQAYGTTPGWSAASNYDAVSAVVEAINRTLMMNKELPKTTFTGKELKKDRYLVKEGLAAINSPETALQTGTRTLYMDEKRNAVGPIAVGLFDKANLVSAFTQLQKIPDIKKVTNLEVQIKSKDIVQISEQYLQKTNIVYVGIDINKVGYLDEKTSTYLVDCYLWFRYKNGVDADNIEFINYGINRLDSGEKLKLSDPIKVGQEAGVNYKVYRIKADFHEEFDFHNYPFDEQLLSVRFRHANLTRDKLIYAIDFVGMRDKSSTTKELPKRWKEEIFKEISAWNPVKVSFYQDTLINNSTLGDREVIDGNSNLEYSQFNTVIQLQRDLLGFSVKNLLPLWFFVVVAYLLLFLPFEQLSAEVLSGLLLAVVFFHLSLLQALPDGVGYVVALDYAFYLVYLLIGLELVLVIVGHRESFQKSELKLRQLTGFGRVAFPIIIMMFSGLFYWLYF
jgi:branched-chain amino acid transport system substrate-binding protein